MIQPFNITAQPDPRGSRVALSWTNPILPGFKGTQVLRRELEFPLVPPDVRNSEGVIFDDVSTPAGATGQFFDTGLRGESVYYYAIVTYDTAFRPYAAFISAMTCVPYQTAAYLYRNIPGVYQAYDTTTSPPSPKLDPADASKGQLLRLIEMFGPQFDLIRSFASAMPSFFDSNRIDGTLLPLLAQSIGWQTNYTASVAVQRNEVRFAPYYYATTGLAANLRATINRLTSWNAQIKEFAHNIFLSNRPEELSIHELQRANGQWQPATGVSLDIAYEGRPSAFLAADDRPWLVYHARQSGSGQDQDRWQLWCKICDRGDWLAAHPLTGDTSINKYPCAVQLAGSIWLFWSSSDPGVSGRPVSQLRSQQLSAGRQALNARAQGTAAGPFAFVDGDTFSITVGTLPRTITLRAEQFSNIAQAASTETAAVLDAELPGIDVTATADGRILFASQTIGAAARIAFPNSTVGAKLGVPGLPATGADAVPSQITGSRGEPFVLADNDTLVITLEHDVPRTVTFTASQTTAAGIAAAINQVLPGVAVAAAGRVRLTSQSLGASSLVSVDVNLSTAAPKLGFGAPIPSALTTADDTEPSAFEKGGETWVFWSSLRGGQWNIWYSRFDGSNWGVPKALTSLSQPDREPFAIFDPANGGRIWLFWSRKKANGLWNIFFRTTATLDFNALTDAAWAEFEMTPVPGNYDNREAAATLSGPGNLDLYFSSNRVDGWHIWNRPVTIAAPQGADTAVISRQFTHRAAAPLTIVGGPLRLFFRANESAIYTSAIYPKSTTVDARYVGSTTADTRNPTRLSLRGSFDDIGHYTYDTPKATAGEEAKRLYSRDTVGVFLGPDTSDQQLIVRNPTLLATALTRFLPIQVRAVLLTGQVYTEYVYSYDQPGAALPEVITDQMTDTIR
jgi:hypothetical protein